MTTTTLGDLLGRADDLCRELRSNPEPLSRNTWESFDATAYLLMRELVGPARTGNRAFALSHASLCRVLDAYPAPLRSATAGPVGAREAAHLLGRPRSAVIAKIRNGQIPATWDGHRYLVDVTDLPSREDVRPADSASRDLLARLSCTLGAAADLLVLSRDQPTRKVHAGAESLDAATAPVLTRVMAIAHVAASHAVKVGPLSDIDRPLAIARYSATSLDALGEVARGSPMLDTASFAPPVSPASVNERLEYALRQWVSAARAELNRTVPSADVIRNVMNQGIHLYAVSGRLLEAAERSRDTTASEGSWALEHLGTAMKHLGEAERLWGSVTTAMPPTHVYVAAARDLHAALTDVTHDGLHALNGIEIASKLDTGQALADLRYAARDLADIARDVQHLPDQLLRSGVLFAQSNTLKPSVDRLQARAAGRYVPVMGDEPPRLSIAARSAANATEGVAWQLDSTLGRMQRIAVADLDHGRALRALDL